MCFSELVLKLILDAHFWQMEYLDWLAGECGIPGVEEWRKEMYYATKKNYVANPHKFRDEWEDEHLVLEAREDFTS